MLTIVFRAVLLAAVLSLHYAEDLRGGSDRSSPRLVGMARANSAVARGLDAVGVNPALFVIPHGANTEIVILPLGLRIGSNFMNYDLYSTYFTGVDDPVTGERVAKHLTHSDKQKILSSLGGGNGRVNIDSEVRWFGLTYRHDFFGGISLTAADRFAGNIVIPQDYLRMLFEGFSEVGSTYNFNGADAQSWWIRQYAVSYATPRLRVLQWLPWTSFGISVKHVQGYAYFGIESYEGYISTKGFDEGFVLGGAMSVLARRAAADFIQDPGAHDFNPLQQPAGTGWGVDIGIAAGITRTLVVGLSVTDIGYLRWSRNTFGSVARSTFEIDDILSSEQQDSLRNSYRGEDVSIGPFTTSLPTALRLGATMRVRPQLIVAADYTQGFNSMPGNSTTPRISAGAEWRPVGFLPLRSGIALGGYDDFTWAFGFGVHVGFFNLDIATENVGIVLYPTKSKQVSVTVGMKLQI